MDNTTQACQTPGSRLWDCLIANKTARQQCINKTYCIFGVYMITVAWLLPLIILMVGYQFESPVLTIHYLIYDLLQLGFIICTVVADTGSSEVLNGGGWLNFYITAITIGIIANLYTFTVIAFWGTIITGMTITIASLVACLLICCFL